MELSKRDLERLQGVHPDLVRVVEIAAARTFMRWGVFEGLRTLDRQKALKAAGKTLTLNSRHITGHAVDLVLLTPKGAFTWEPWQSYHALGAEVLDVAARMRIALRWGGLFRGDKGQRFFDGAHFELTHEFYPDQPAAAPVVA